MDEQSLESELLEVSPAELDLVVTYGLQEIKRLAVIEANLVEHKTFLTTDSPAWGYYVNMKASDFAATVGENGLMINKATQNLRES